MTSAKLDGYIFAISKNKKKKYDVYNGKTGKRITSFGARGMDQYYDKIGAYAAYDHLDKTRRKRYYQRHGTTATKDSAKYFSHKYLW